MSNHEALNYKSFLLSAAAGLLVVAAVFNIALAQNNALTPEKKAALEDLSALYGQPVTSVRQAKEICDQEKYFVACAEIGKRHNLYNPEDLPQVDTLLAEIKGRVADDLAACTDELCLIEVANRLAEQVVQKNPDLAAKIGLTKTLIKEKEEIVIAAHETGVTFEECRTMDSDTAPIGLLRKCFKLAQDERLERYIPEKQKTKIKNIDPMIEFREALRRGDYACGEGTLESCGEFCLNPSPEARKAGAAVIPPVCRQIAEKFFGPEGVAELEAAYNQVNQASDYYQKKIEHIAFKTAKGKILRSFEEIGRYMEKQAKLGNVEAVEKGMDYLIANSFATKQDKEFALKMIGKVKESGFDIDTCIAKPEVCQEFIPEEYRGGFNVMDRIDKIVRGAMTSEGVPGPEFCDDPRYGNGCLRAAKKVLPEIEAIAEESPEAKFIVQEIKGRIEFGERGFEARERAYDEFNREGKIAIGGKLFNNFEEVEQFCKGNGQLCLAEAAKKGFIEKDFAAQKYKQTFTYQYRPSDFYGAADFLVSPPPGVPGEPGYVSPPGFYLPSFTGPGFAPLGFEPGKFDKDKALADFKNWLENPIGPPPVPGFGPEPIFCPMVMPRLCKAGETPIPPDPSDPCGMPSCEYRGAPYPAPGPYPGPYPRPGPTITFPYTFSDGTTVQSWEEGKKHCFNFPPETGRGISKECEEKFGIFYPGPGKYCGNRICEPPDENNSNCPVDCGGYASTCENDPYFCKSESECTSSSFYWCEFGCFGAPCPEQDYCGDGICSQFEDPIRCSIDCGAPPPPQDYCGDNYCSPTESATTCPSDCAKINWKDYKWSFSDNTGVSSKIFNRTDKEYLDYIAKVAKQCQQIPQSQFRWKPGAGDSRPENWKNFGIPDCSGAPPPGAYCGNNYCDPGETYTSCPQDCGAPPPGSYCAPFTTQESCERDSGCKWRTPTAGGTGWCEQKTTTGGYCGDGYCNNYENQTSCPQDCGGPGPGTGNCPFGFHYHAESGGFCMNDQENYSGTCYDLSGTVKITCPAYQPPTSCGPGMEQKTLSSGYTYCVKIGAACPSASSFVSQCPNGPFNWSNDGCPTGCFVYPGGATTTYPGDQNSCPGFAYSKWDQNGIRYCELNNVRSCSYNYPAYLDATNYSVDNCPQEPGAYCNYNGVCDGNENIDVCPSDCGGATTSTPPDPSIPPDISRGCYVLRDWCDSYWSPIVDKWGVQSTFRCAKNHHNSTCVTHDAFKDKDPCFQKYGIGWKTKELTTGNCYDTFSPSFKTSEGTLYSCNNIPAGISAPGCVPTVACGNNVCESGETAASCPSDCATGTSTSTPACGNNICESGENSSNCSADCGSAQTETCGNNFCGSGETATSCPADCASGNYCGDGTCGSNESSYSCPSDCGAYSSGSQTCDNNLIALLGTGCHYMYNDSAGNPIFCDGPMTQSAKQGDTAPTSGCTSSASGTSGSCPSGFHWHFESGGFCMNDQENYSGTCYDTSGATVITCPSGGSYGSGGSYCGNYVCDSGETASSCPVDCGGGGGGSSVCYDCASCQAAGCPNPAQYPNDSACAAFNSSACPPSGGAVPTESFLAIIDRALSNIANVLQILLNFAR